MSNAEPRHFCGCRQRIIQIHPTLRCNLACAHCYSDSGPEATLTLDSALVCSALSDAASLGYGVVSFSGGEPLLYRGLDSALAHGRSCGMRTTVTTNGTLLARVPRFAGLIDLLAISLDGPQDLHNRVRASDRAFDLLVCGLNDVRTAGVKFGFIHTLTRESWEHLPWLADFAVEQGAALLQLHPLELAGRAGELMRGDRPEDDTLARAYLLATTLASKYEGRLTIQLDVFHTEHLLEYPELAYAADLGPDLSIYRAADLLSPVVVEADATVVPVCYGFSRDYAICNLKEEALAAAWPRYLRERYPMFASLCRRVFKEATIPRDLPFLNWYELILASSRATAFAQAAL